ncbi:MAG: hypothetical protein HGA39_08710 [Coriobacteriia bacterium]|nr:hypothetical protein [Coriobacteriia bacterium]
MSREIDLTKALHWYSVLATYDAAVAPSRWVWSELDVEVNRRLNELIWQSSSNWLYVPDEFHGIFSSVVADPPPDSTREWASDSPRLSMNITSATYVPRYFPDASNDLFLLSGKDFMVTGYQLALIDALEEIVAEDGIPVIDPSDVSEPPEGRVYFSMSQYIRFHPYVAAEVKDFSTQPDTRAALYKRWRDGCFPEGDLAVGVLQQAGGSLATIPLPVAQDLMRTLWFEE